MSDATIRRVLLEAIAEADAESGPLRRSGSFQQRSILEKAQQRLGLDSSKEQALLTAWYDLFRSGHLAWGHNLLNPDPPHCHLTEQGRRTLEHISRDPANPDGYRSHLRSAALNPICDAYINEALDAYNANCFRAAVVMVGAAAESLVIELRDLLAKQIGAGERTPRDLADFRIKKVLEGLQRELQSRRASMPASLAESLEAYWPAFTHQIRRVRNEVGHPVSVAAIGPDGAHATLLVFPEVASMAKQLRDWILAQGK